MTRKNGGDFYEVNRASYEALVVRHIWGAHVHNCTCPSVTMKGKICARPYLLCLNLPRKEQSLVIYIYCYWTLQPYVMSLIKLQISFNLTVFDLVRLKSQFQGHSNSMPLAMAIYSLECFSLCKTNSC